MVFCVAFPKDGVEGCGWRPVTLPPSSFLGVVWAKAGGNGFGAERRERQLSAKGSTRTGSLCRAANPDSCTNLKAKCLCASAGSEMKEASRV